MMALPWWHFHRVALHPSGGPTALRPCPRMDLVFIGKLVEVISCLSTFTDAVPTPKDNWENSGGWGFSGLRIHGLFGKSVLAGQVLRWFETVFHFPFQLNFMKGLLICSKRLLLLVDSRCCNNLSTYQLLYCYWHFGCHGNLTGPQIHPISSTQLHFTQKVVDELPFLLHQNCLHIKEHFLRKFKKILSRGFGATLIFCNIKVA